MSLRPAGVEGGIDVDEIRDPVGEATENVEIVPENDLVHDLPILGMHPPSANNPRRIFPSYNREARNRHHGIQAEAVSRSAGQVVCRSRMIAKPRCGSYDSPAGVVHQRLLRSQSRRPI